MAPPELKAGPVTRVCHVCGRQYGLSSFEIHLKQCKKLFLAQEELKPRNERRPLPRTPPGLGNSQGVSRGGSPSGEEGGHGDKPTREMVEAMNRAAQETYNEHGMEKCENCGRTFAEGRLVIHAKSCRPGNAARRVEEGVAPRNKRETNAEVGTIPSIKKVLWRSTLRPATTDREEMSPARPTAAPSTPSSATARPLAGSLASNRKKITSQDAISSGGSLRSPLGSVELNEAALRRELQGKETVVSVINAKLDHWEATTLAALQEIRDLKQLFAQINEG